MRFQPGQVVWVYGIEFPNREDISIILPGKEPELVRVMTELCDGGDIFYAVEDQEGDATYYPASQLHVTKKDALLAQRKYLKKAKDHISTRLNLLKSEIVSLKDFE